MELIKSFNGKSEAEIKAGGFKIFIEWDELMLAIQYAVRLRPDEFIAGFVAEEKGLNVTIERKRGRKVSDEV